MLMERKSIAQVVAEALAWHIKRKETNAKALGEKAGLSPRTVGNFLNPDKRVSSASGKIPSGKLTELEMIARALGVKFIDLVSDMDDAERLERERFEEALSVMRRPNGSQPTSLPLDSFDGENDQLNQSGLGKTTDAPLHITKPNND